MSADFLSGLLLIGVLLFGAAYLVKAFFWESLLGLMAQDRQSPPAQPNDHLIGAVGRVIDDGAASGTLRVRVGMETWRARAADPSSVLPTGAEVEIRAIEGLVLEVTPKAIVAEQPST